MKNQKKTKAKKILPNWKVKKLPNDRKKLLTRKIFLKTQITSVRLNKQKKFAKDWKKKPKSPTVQRQIFKFLWKKTANMKMMKPGILRRRKNLPKQMILPNRKK